MFEIPQSFVDPVASRLAGPDSTVSNAVRMVVGGQMFIVVVEHVFGEETMPFNYLFAHIENFLAQETNRPSIRAVFLLMSVKKEWVVHSITRIFSSPEGFVAESATGEILVDGFRIEVAPNLPSNSQVVWEN